MHVFRLSHLGECVYIHSLRGCAVLGNGITVEYDLGDPEF